MPDLTQKDLRYTNLDGLKAIVQYMGRSERPDVSPQDWLTMAAFDNMSIAEDYVEKCCVSNHWQYRAIEIPEDCHED